MDNSDGASIVHYFALFGIVLGIYLILFRLFVYLLWLVCVDDKDKKKRVCLTALSCSSSISRVGVDVDSLASSGSDVFPIALQCLVRNNAVDFCLKRKRLKRVRDH